MNPKFKVGDKVTFKLDGGEVTGIIYIVDNGTFMKPDKVMYDVMVENSGTRCLYKHIAEEGLYGKIS